jgi:ribosome maturation factor RimP
MSKIEERARELAEPFLEQNGCALWDVLFEKEGAMNYLRILFDNADPEFGALDMDKCERLTPHLNSLMDKQDFISQVDIVEIGSPGITRRLRRREHFDFCMNKNIRVMKRSDNGKTEIITGILRGFDAENKSIKIDVDKNICDEPLKKCIRITLEEQPQ